MIRQKFLAFSTRKPRPTFEAENRHLLLRFVLSWQIQESPLSIN
jgi:hypothetical protein